MASSSTKFRGLLLIVVKLKFHAVYDIVLPIAQFVSWWDRQFFVNEVAGIGPAPAPEKQCEFASEKVWRGTGASSRKSMSSSILCLQRVALDPCRQACARFVPPSPDW
jgi:hypothetical protein